VADPGAPGDPGLLSLRAGPYLATVRRLGGGLQQVRCGERDLLQAGPATGPNHDAHGDVLIPWPNRLGDGRYTFAGTDHQLPIDEPAHGNAIHGLVRHREWDVATEAPDAVTLAITLDEPTGYPFTLAVEVRYELDADGLTVITTATNRGTGPCPYGAGQHPYLSPGLGRIDDAVVRVDAATRLVTDERQLPVGREPVTGTATDLRTAAPIGARQLDDAVTDLGRDDAGRAWATLTGADGTTVALWVDEHYPVLQLYTGDHSGDPGARRGGLAVEPMTCPADAFRTGDHLVTLGPGERHIARWGLTAR